MLPYRRRARPECRREPRVGSHRRSLLRCQATGRTHRAMVINTSRRGALLELGSPSLLVPGQRVAWQASDIHPVWRDAVVVRARPFLDGQIVALENAHHDPC